MGVLNRLDPENSRRFVGPDLCPVIRRRQNLSLTGKGLTHVILSFCKHSYFICYQGETKELKCKFLSLIFYDNGTRPSISV